MTKREAKRRACLWVANILDGDAFTHCALHQDNYDGTATLERTDEDADRMFDAFDELRKEMLRRA